MAGLLGVDASVKVLSATAELFCDACDLAKGGLSLGKIRKIMEVMEGLTLIAAQAPSVLPELKELDAEDTAKIGAAGYSAVAKVVNKLKA